MKQVLIVDDKPENLYLLNALLKANSFMVDEASHGAEALEKAQKNLPDLIISDLLMPVMDGYTLLKCWKADERLKKIPFVVYTATYTQSSDEKLAMDLGADAYIIKPEEPGQFMVRIFEMLKKEKRDELIPPHLPKEEEKILLKEYNEVLIRKLEEKTIQLEKDIAERTKLMDELKERESFIASVLDTTPDLIYIYDLEDQKNIYHNDGIQTAFGYTREDVEKIGNQFLSLKMNPEDYDNYLKNIIPQYASLKNKAIITYEHRMKNKAGEWRNVLSRDSVFLRHTDGSPKLIFGYASDITDRIKAAEEIKQLNRDLEQRVKDRTAELQKVNDDLQDINDIFIGNELKMYEMKKELESLKKQLNK